MADGGMMVEKIRLLGFHSARMDLFLDYSRSIGVADYVDHDPKEARLPGQAEELHDRRE